MKKTLFFLILCSLACCELFTCEVRNGSQLYSLFPLRKLVGDPYNFKFADRTYTFDFCGNIGSPKKGGCNDPNSTVCIEKSFHSTKEHQTAGRATFNDSIRIIDEHNIQGVELIVGHGDKCTSGQVWKTVFRLNCSSVQFKIVSIREDNCNLVIVANTQAACPVRPKTGCGRAVAIFHSHPLFVFFLASSACTCFLFICCTCCCLRRKKQCKNSKIALQQIEKASSEVPSAVDPDVVPLLVQAPYLGSNPLPPYANNNQVQGYPSFPYPQFQYMLPSNFAYPPPFAPAAPVNIEQTTSDEQLARELQKQYDME